MSELSNLLVQTFQMWGFVQNLYNYIIYKVNFPQISKLEPCDRQYVFLNFGWPALSSEKHINIWINNENNGKVQKPVNQRLWDVCGMQPHFHIHCITDGLLSFEEGKQNMGLPVPWCPGAVAVASVRQRWRWCCPCLSARRGCFRWLLGHNNTKVCWGKNAIKKINSFHQWPHQTSPPHKDKLYFQIKRKSALPTLPLWNKLLARLFLKHELCETSIDHKHMHSEFY